MHPAVRTQVDGEQLEYSRATSIIFDPTKDMTRQEHKTETDINFILARYNATGTLPLRPTQMGEVDFGMDLQQAIHSVEAAKRMYAKLPDTLRDKYRTWQDLLNALENGELRLDLQEDADEKKAAAEVAAARAAGKIPADDPELDLEPDTPSTRGRKIN